MKKVVAFQIAILATIIFTWVKLNLGLLPDWINAFTQPMECVLVAALGGNLYCLRAIYKNRCVENRWDEHWEIWYYLRPITSAISGFVSFIFLKAGLVILDASQQNESSGFGFLAFSFIAGLNVDKFIQKIEEIAKSTFGIEKSRSSANESDKKH